MPLLKISPRYDSTKLNNALLEDRIDVYEDRVRGWLIDCGRILNNHEHAGFGVLQIALSYFEAHAVFLRGKDSKHNSKPFFKVGFEAVFPDMAKEPQVFKQLIDTLYDDGRCGLFHLGMARRRVVLRDGAPVFRFAHDARRTRIETIYIDRYALVDRIDSHLTSYVRRLRDPSEVELRKRFAAAWSLVHQ